MPEQSTRRGELGGHARELELDGLMPGDRHAELHPFPGVGDGELERALVHADGLRRDSEPRMIERRESDLETGAFGSEELARRNPALGERDRCGHRGAQSELLLGPADLDAGRFGVDDEGGDPRFPAAASVFAMTTNVPATPALVIQTLAPSST